MHSTNFDATISEQYLAYINLNLKILNILARLSDVAKQRSRAVTNVAKRRIENFKSNINKQSANQKIKLFSFLNTIKTGAE